MKKLLVQLDSDKHPSLFDTVVAYDGGADQVIGYGNVALGDVRDLVHGAIFTRGGSQRQHTAIFIGGSDVALAGEMLAATTAEFFGKTRVSVMLDPSGANTTAAAAVLKLRGALPLQGQRTVVLAGTGPVGERAALLLAKEGAEVLLTSRKQARAEETAQRLAESGIAVTPVAVHDDQTLARALEGATVLVAAGAAGIRLAPEAAWRGATTLRAMADVNAVPPTGIEGVRANDDGAEREGVVAFGALGVGGLKLKMHRACVARLFEQNDLVLDTEAIYAIGQQLLAERSG